MPAASMAAILSSALPLPPEMMAPAWPIRRPGGAVWPAQNPTPGFFPRFLTDDAANFAHHDDGVGIRIFVEEVQRIQKMGSDDGIAADADAGGLADAQV